jgi:hypothetical protein
MKPLRSLALAITAAAILGSSQLAMAQQKRVSPPDVAGSVVEGNRVTIYYGSPRTKDPKSGEPRKIWGGVVPFGQVWRLGANEATLLVTQKPIEISGTTIPAGAHTLFLLPAEDGNDKLIVNNQIGQWGTQYDEKQDLARIDVKRESAEKPADQLTITVGKNPGKSGGLIKITWADGQYNIPFSVEKK